MSKIGKLSDSIVG